MTYDVAASSKELAMNVYCIGRDCPEADTGFYEHLNGFQPDPPIIHM